MKAKRMTRCLMATILVLSGAAHAAEVSVGAFGEHGWYSDDTRSNSGADLVGPNYTHAGKPGQIPAAADDAIIADQIRFVNDAPEAVQALKLSWSAGTGSGKATLSTINADSGFATDNWQEGFSANLRTYRETNTNTTLKIGIQSTDWASSQSGFTASRSGESSWDLILVYTGAGITPGSWQTASITSDSGTWNLFDQAGNSYYTTPGNSANKTLAGWAADSTWEPKLFGEGAKVSNIQIGAGSFSVPSTGYVDYLEISLLNGGDRINFVPEPTALGLLALGGLALLRKRSR